MATRKEHDFIGELEISDDFYYGVQTFRATENFHMSGRTLKEYPYFVKAFAQIKKAAALANKEVGVLDPNIADALAKAADRVIAGEFLLQISHLRAWVTKKASINLFIQTITQTLDKAQMTLIQALLR